MEQRYSRRIAAWAVFVIGIFLMVAGILLLLRTIAGFSRVAVLFSTLFLALGFIFALVAIRLYKSSAYVFAASFILMVGFYVFLSALGLIPRQVLLRSWPLVSVFSGFALVPAGRRHYGAFIGKFLVPACVFVILGGVLLIFSFDIVTFSFKQFILKWWPLLIAVSGIILVLVSLGVKHDPSGRNDPKDEQ
jgi:hypothetical protein